MLPLHERARLAGIVRVARCSLSEASAKLLHVGLDDVLFQLTNIECQLEQVHAQLMEPAVQVPPLPPGARRPHCQEELPF